MGESRDGLEPGFEAALVEDSVLNASGSVDNIQFSQLTTTVWAPEQSHFSQASSLDGAAGAIVHDSLATGNINSL